jgi:hypothetical protein
VRALVTSPRPVPSLVVPAAAGSGVVALALPVFLLAAWPLAGWALAAVLWLGGQAVGLLLARLPLGAEHARAAGVAGVGMTFRSLAVGVVLIAVAASDTALGLSAAVVYALAYTLELAVALTVYFGSEPA